MQATSMQNWNTFRVEVTFDDYVAVLRKFCDEVKKTGKNVVLVAPSPILFHFSKEVHGNGAEYAAWLYRRGRVEARPFPVCFTMSKTEYFEGYANVLSVLNQLEREGVCDILHIEKGIFRDGDFLGYKNGVLRMRDNTHITPNESVEMLRVVRDDFVQIIEKGRKAQKKVN
jgi:hypothetical protein